MLRLYVYKPDIMATKLDIIYEDNHLIVVYKPHGMLTQGDKTGDISLFALVKKYLKEKYAKPGNVYLGLLHRLDRPTSGLIIFAKTSKASSRLSKQFREGEIQKKYLTMVEGVIKVGDSKKIIHYLKKDPDKNIVKIRNKPLDNSYKKSILEYSAPNNKIRNSSYVIGNFLNPAKLVYPQKTNFTLLEINLITGRSHQIRAQLSYLGYPIVGDIKYGAQAPLPQKNICLVSHRLTIKHPTKNNRLTLTLPGI